MRRYVAGKRGVATRKECSIAPSGQYAPNPVQAPTGKAFRQVLCRFYGLCLDDAIKNTWTGFTCLECQAFEFDEMTPGELEEHARCCMALLLEIYGAGYRERIKKGERVQLSVTGHRQLVSPEWEPR